MTSTGTGAFVGMVTGVGLLLVVRGAPWFTRPDLDDRLAPYLRDTPRPSRLLSGEQAVTPFTTLDRLLRPALAEWSAATGRLLGGSAATRRRLQQAGRTTGVEEFRTEQALWAALGFLGALGLSVLLFARGVVDQPVALVAFAGLAATGGVLLRDVALTREIARRDARMTAEFPTVAEMLALAVTAGEGPAGALERVCALGRGDLARELSRVLDDVRAGDSLVQALDRLARRTSLPALARFVDGLAVALERGTPLADVLRAQAADVREGGKRALLEAGGRKEIAMMVPVVFLVLPVTVVFALFPGFYGFTVGSP